MPVNFQLLKYGECKTKLPSSQWNQLLLLRILVTPDPGVPWSKVIIVFLCRPSPATPWAAHQLFELLPFSSVSPALHKGLICCFPCLISSSSHQLFPWRPRNPPHSVWSSALLSSSVLQAQNPGCAWSIWLLILKSHFLLLSAVCTHKLVITSSPGLPFSDSRSDLCLWNWTPRYSKLSKWLFFLIFHLEFPKISKKHFLNTA